MDRKNFKISFFHVGPEQADPSKEFSNEDFKPAAEDEKQSMVHMHSSVSYWRDAARRFKSNKVSMVALFVFLIFVIFVVAGPYLIPYNYSDQYRSSQKLEPFTYSDDEQMIKDLVENVDAVYATSLQPGSLTALKAGDYWFEFKGETYSITLESKLSNGSLVIDLDADNIISIVYDDDIENGEILESTPLSYETGSDSVLETATQIKLTTSLFPHVFGTDSMGRDIMARCMYGGRVSLLVGVFAALIVLIIGSIYGSVSGLTGGRVDSIMMRIVDIVYSVPDVLVVLLLQVVLHDPLQSWFDSSKIGFVKSMGSLGVGIISILITFALIYWVGMARIVRGQVLQLKQQEYVTAANAIGVSKSQIIKRHLLPNCVGQIVIATCLQIPSAIFLESFLSFLGLGVSAPMTSLGSLCSEALDTIALTPYRLVCPAIMLIILVLSLNLIGDGLRDALDPKLKK